MCSWMKIVGVGTALGAKLVLIGPLPTSRHTPPLPLDHSRSNGTLSLPSHPRHPHPRERLHARPRQRIAQQRERAERVLAATSAHE